MSKTHKTTCIVLSCKHYGKTGYADVFIVKRHLRTHSWDELRKVAFEIGLTDSEYPHASVSWLADKLAPFCILREQVQ